MLDYKNKKVLVIGVGASGIAAARLLHSVGTDVRCTDLNTSKKLIRTQQSLQREGIKVEIGGHSRNFYRGCELVVVSPGVGNNSSPVVWADKAGIPIISEIELGYQFCSSPIVAVTGTNGKTTATTMITRILNRGGIKSLAAGNIGSPLCAKLKQAAQGEILIVETSSYQLERIVEFKPFVSMILNITPDHLDRYGSFDKYCAAKFRMFENQQKNHFAVINADDPAIAGLDDHQRHGDYLA